MMSSTAKTVMAEIEKELSTQCQNEDDERD